MCKMAKSRKERERLAFVSSRSSRDPVKLILEADTSERPASAKETGTKGKMRFQEDADGERFEFPRNKIAEIQISTVVMHAWSQVEHDVIYKNPYNIDVNDSMIRMLDAVNGLSINSEILLDELRRTIDRAKREENRRADLRFDSLSFSEFLSKEYLKKNDDWYADPRWLSIVSSWACSEEKSANDIATPAKLRGFVTKHNILVNDPESVVKLDIAAAILKELGVQYLRKTKHDLFADLYLPRDGFNYSQVPISYSYYPLMVVANAFSIMVAIDGQAAIKKFTDRFPKGTNWLRQINAIVLCINPDDPGPGDPPLLDIANEFLTASKYETHNIAVALASLRHHIDIPKQLKSAEEAEAEAEISWKGISLPDMTKYGDFHPVFFRKVEDHAPSWQFSVSLQQRSSGGYVEGEGSQNARRGPRTMVTSTSGIDTYQGFRIIQSNDQNLDEILSKTGTLLRRMSLARVEGHLQLMRMFLYSRVAGRKLRSYGEIDKVLNLDRPEATHLYWPSTHEPERKMEAPE